MCTKQLNNVGNLGDVIKHSAQLAVSQAIAGREGRILYVETHAFRPNALLGSKGWEVDDPRR